MKKLIILCSLACLLFTSCKKIIEIDTNNAEPQLVIEGVITNQIGDQVIKISKSVSYDDQSIFPAVSGAVVSVSDSRGNTYNFTENAAGVYALRMRGIAGVTYTMKAVVEGKTYTAISKMPTAVRLDSIGVVVNTFFNNERKTIAAYVLDPAGEANYYHFNMYVNDFQSDRVYVNNDRLTNGNNLRLQLFYSKNDDDDEGLVTGDKVAVDMHCIDANIFNYWYALSQQSGRGPNQGTTPANPTSNISNGALGYFSAQTNQRLSIVVP